MKQEIVTPFATQKSERPVQLGYNGNYVEIEGFGRCLDANAGYWYKILGHNNPELIEARNRDTSGSHLYEGFIHQEAERLAQKLKDKSGFAQVCYSLSGSMANENAVKAAFLYHKAKGRDDRNIVVSLKGAYHGDTEMLCHIAGFDYATFMPQRDISRKIRPPYMAKSDDEILDRANELSDLMESEELQDRIAAFIYEPVMGVRGAVTLPGIYLSRIKEICEEHDILMMGDEVTTGMGRTGTLFAYQHTSIRPDIMALGKAFTNGEYPLAATLFNNRVVEAMDELQERNPQSRVYVFGNTLAGLPAGCLVAQKVLQIHERDHWGLKVWDKGKYALEKLDRLKSLPNVRDVRGMGLMIAIDSQNSGLAEKVQEEMRERKVHLIPEGRMIMFMPPFTITEEEIDYFADNLEEVLSSS